MLQRGVNATLPRIEQLADEAFELGRCLRKTGLAGQMRMAGVRTALQSLVLGGPSPSLIYRIHAANSPDRVAIRCGGRALSYETLNFRIDKLANGLVQSGFTPGDRAIVMLRNGAEFVEVQAALARAGGSAVNVSSRATVDELAYVWAHAGAKWIFFDSAFSEVVGETRSRLANGGAPVGRGSAIVIGGENRDARSYDELFKSGNDGVINRRLELDAAVILYTSGTTGAPKGAVRKFPRGALKAALQFIAETPMHSDDVHLTVLPLYHSTAYAFLGFTHLLGGTVVIAPEFSPTSFLTLVDTHAVTTTAVVPTMLHRLVALDDTSARRFSTSSLRAIFSCGAPLSGPLAVNTMDRFGDILFNGYGATETGLVTLATPRDLRDAPGTIGRPVPGSSIRLLDNTGSEVLPGEVGELYAQNAMLVEGYHRDAEATQSSMRDGYFSVGDLARVDGGGRYFIEGRARDMVISGGVNVYPAEVERAYEEHPAVDEIAVVGVPDDEWGERVCAFVVLKREKTADAEALRAWGRTRLAIAKVPRDFLFVDELPRNPTGKVLKTALRRDLRRDS